MVRLLFIISGLLLLPMAAFADQPICQDFESSIEPDMQRHEDDFSKESFEWAQETLNHTVPEWMEEKFELYMQNPDEGRKLIEGEIWLARENALAVVKGYVLKLEYLNASGLDVEKARERFCTFVTVTPVFD